MPAVFLFVFNFLIKFSEKNSANYENKSNKGAKLDLFFKKDGGNKKRKERKKKAKKKAPDKSAKPAEKKGKKEKKKLPFTFDDVRSVVPVVFEALQKALGKIRRKMRVDPLTVSISFGGEDPVEVAQMYGWTNTAVWTMMPPLEQMLHIPNPHIHLETDYNSLCIKAEGRVGVKFRVGDLIIIGLTLALPLLRWYLDWRRKQPGQTGTKKEATKNV